MNLGSTRPLALLFASLLTLSACTGEDDPGPFVIEYAAVTGGDGVPNEGIPREVSPSEIYPDDPVGFDLYWELSGGETESGQVRWHVSTDQFLDSGDPLIVSRNCGLGLSSPDCEDLTGFVNCYYDSDSRIYCGQDGRTGIGDDADLAFYFSNTNGLPGRYYLILNALDATSAQFDREVFEVRFD